MTADDVTVEFRRAKPEDPLGALVEALVERARTTRGARAVVEELWGSPLTATELASALEVERTAGHVWVARRGPEIVAGALVTRGCVRGIWVQPDQRRRHIGVRLLRAILDDDDPPRDAWALPGDRATKSLYESVGWKARLLTMRGE